MAASYLRVFLILIVVFLAVSSAKDPLKELFQRNMKRSTQFKCSKPKPTSFHSRDIFSKNSQKLSASEQITPSMTMLNLCGARSGCCLQGDNYSCAPFKYEEITLVYRVKNQLTGIERLMELRVKEHLRCSCQKMKSDNHKPGSCEE